MRITVFSFFDDLGLVRYPLYLSEKPYKREVDLLYSDEHFALITSFSGFLSDLSLAHGRKYICRQCFGRHMTQQALDNHKPFCNRIDQANQVYLLPDAGSDIHFKNVRYMQESPIVIYADFECKTVAIEERTNGKNFYQEHRATSFAYKVVFRCIMPETHKFDNVKVFHSENPAKELLDSLEEIEPELIEFLARRSGWR